MNPAQSLQQDPRRIFPPEPRVAQVTSAFTWRRACWGSPFLLATSFTQGTYHIVQKPARSTNKSTTHGAICPRGKCSPVTPAKTPWCWSRASNLKVIRPGVTQSLPVLQSHVSHLLGRPVSKHKTPYGLLKWVLLFLLPGSHCVLCFLTVENSRSNINGLPLAPSGHWFSHLLNLSRQAF